MTTATPGRFLHPGLTGGRWFDLNLVEQLANIGSEVGRSIRARDSGNSARFENAFARGLELFDLTLADPRWRGRRREIARAREVVCDFLVGDNEHASTAEAIDRYFLAFGAASRATRDRDGKAGRLVAEVKGSATTT
jgi:hypothetical protein